MTAELEIRRRPRLFSFCTVELGTCRRFGATVDWSVETEDSTQVFCFLGRLVKCVCGLTAVVVMRGKAENWNVLCGTQVKRGVSTRWRKKDSR